MNCDELMLLLMADRNGIGKEGHDAEVQGHVEALRARGLLAVSFIDDTNGRMHVHPEGNLYTTSASGEALVRRVLQAAGAELGDRSGKTKLVRCPKCNGGEGWDGTRFTDESGCPLCAGSGEVDESEASDYYDNIKE